MNLAWEVALRAIEQEMDARDLHYKPDCNGSPYRETAFQDINLSRLMSQEVEINPLYRFTHIFGFLFDINLREWPELREMMFDVYMHYQSQMDLRRGLTKSEYYIRAILKDILNGVYGTAAAEAIILFENEDVKNILYGMLRRFQEQDPIEIFRQVVRSIYPRAVIYRNADVYREILMYLPIEKSDQEQRKIEFLISMFLDINYTVYVFWTYHFGVIGIDETLKFGEMVMF